jgi:hypothetical protein
MLDYYSMKINSHCHNPSSKISLFHTRRWIASISHFFCIAAVAGLVLMHSTAIGNAAARHAEFIDLVGNNEPQALELLQTVIADPTLPGAADILRTAILLKSSSAHDLIAPVIADLPFSVRAAVHSAFAELGDKRMETDLRALAESVDQADRQMILPMFSGAGTEASLPYLLAQMEQGNVAFGNLVAAVIVRMDLPQLDDQLLKMLVAGSREEQLHAIKLASIRNPYGTEKQLIGILLTTDSADKRNAILAGLERIGTGDSARLLLRLIGEAENVADARPYQVAFRRLAPRLEGEVGLLWSDAFLPVWRSVESVEIRNALLLMVSSMRGNESGHFLIRLIRDDDELRNTAIAQLRSWNHWDAAEFVLAAIELETLSESQRGDFFTMGAALLSPRIQGGRGQKQNFANRLLQAAPTAAIQEQVRAAILEANLSL